MRGEAGCQNLSHATQAAAQAEATTEVQDVLQNLKCHMCTLCGNIKQFSVDILLSSFASWLVYPTILLWQLCKSTQA